MNRNFVGFFLLKTSKKINDVTRLTPKMLFSHTKSKNRTLKTLGKMKKKIVLTCCSVDKVELTIFFSSKINEIYI